MFLGYYGGWREAGPEYFLFWSNVTLCDISYPCPKRGYWFIWYIMILSAGVQILSQNGNGPAFSPKWPASLGRRQFQNALSVYSSEEPSGFSNRLPSVHLAHHGGYCSDAGLAMQGSLGLVEVWLALFGGRLQHLFFAGFEVGQGGMLERVVLHPLSMVLGQETQCPHQGANIQEGRAIVEIKQRVDPGRSFHF
ncbi:hypothetical protein C8F01DRAFT_1079456 [Mycena amicta]|nr:hypothetical protein C8F01DRAFT_1079456 [Mycena amicta]